MVEQTTRIAQAWCATFTATIDDKRCMPVVGIDATFRTECRLQTGRSLTAMPVPDRFCTEEHQRITGRVAFRSLDRLLLCRSNSLVVPAFGIM
jgi:hypothetical protein